MKTEITFKPLSGYMLLIVAVALPLIAAYFFTHQLPLFGGISILIWVLIAIGFSIVGPNESLVLVLDQKLQKLDKYIIFILEHHLQVPLEIMLNSLRKIF